MTALAAILLAAGPAGLTAPDAVADAGRAGTGPPLVRRFTVFNSSAAVVTVVGVKTPCGCVAPAVEPRVIPAGGTATVTLVVNTLAQSAGKHTWAGAVRYTVAGRPPGEAADLDWALTAELSRQVTATPPAAAVSTGSDRPVTLTVTVTDARPEPLAVRAALVTSPHLTATAGPPTTTPAGRQVAVTVTVAGTLPPGVHVETLVVHTDDPACPEVRVPVTVTKRPAGAVVAVPEAAAVRLAAGETAGSVLVRLRSPGGGPVAVTGVTADHPAVSAKWSPAPAPVAAVRAVVTLRPADPATGAAALTVTLADPPGTAVVVPVTWDRPAP